MFDGCFLLFDSWCLQSVVVCSSFLWFVVVWCCLLFVDRSSLFVVVCLMLYLVCRSLCLVCWLLFVDCISLLFLRY